jgi:transposase
LAIVAPEWLLTITQPEWLERYEKRFEDERLPEAAAARKALAVEVGQDGSRLLTAIADADTPDWLRSIPAIETLRRVWIQNYTWTEQEALRWRTNEEPPPAGQYISS